MTKHAKTRTIDNPLPEDDSLYNIYTLSFNNIKGSASHVVRGRTLVSIKRLEERLTEIIDEYNLDKTLSLGLGRRAHTTHSSLSWRLTRKDRTSKYIAFDDPEFQERLEGIDEDRLHRLRVIDNELKILNSNLKIEWVKYLEFCAHSHELHPGEPITPKMMPKCLDPRT